ncbi:hypothetical protein TrCOL_g1996 [Triparma columacea]|uniref:Uncharacterized protein n=1 Tax=Triparma columacea TaxID=722753 RepID=A0A9W7LE86_9STRA|nr:hypothetical protein TrCOL_g1996 [Triparma columacea]
MRPPEYPRCCIVGYLDVGDGYTGGVVVAVDKGVVVKVVKAGEEEEEEVGGEGEGGRWRWVDNSVGVLGDEHIGKAVLKAREGGGIVKIASSGSHDYYYVTVAGVRDGGKSGVRRWLDVGGENYGVWGAGRTNWEEKIWRKWEYRGGEGVGGGGEGEDDDDDDDDEVSFKKT